MLTVGVDLAAEPANTAVARVRWVAGRVEVEALAVGADDAMLVDEIVAADKAGLDCPLGWPRRFVEFVAQHQDGRFVAPADIAGKDWRRRLALRETDLATRAATGLVPLSVAADRIGLAAMRCAGLLARLAAAGQLVDRAGSGVVVEVYPAAALKHWGLPYRGYKGHRQHRRPAPAGGPAVCRGALAPAGRLRAGLPAQRPRPRRRHRRADRPRRRCAAPPHRPPSTRPAARTEGWIAPPTGSLTDLTSNTPD